LDIEALFEYNWYCRRKFLEAMARLHWGKVVEDRGASFSSMRNIFLHSLEAEQGWLGHLARGKMGEWPSHEYDRDFKDMEAVRNYMNEVEVGSRTYFSKLKPGDLDNEFPIGKGKFRVEDVLMHVVEEEIHHRGELICLMWQIDSEPPYASYTNYVAEMRAAKGT